MQIGDTVLTEECVGSKVTYVPSHAKMILASGKVEQYLPGMINMFLLTMAKVQMLRHVHKT